MFFIKGLTVLLSSVFILNAAENDHPITPKTTFCFRDIVAGQYYQNASVFGHGTSHASLYHFLKNHLGQDRRFTYHEATSEDNEFLYSIFFRKETSQVVLLPLKHKETGYFLSPTLSGLSTERFPVYPHPSLKDITIKCIEALASILKVDLAKNKLTVHTTFHEGSSQDLYHFRNFRKMVFKLFMSNHRRVSPGHLIYGAVEIDGEQTQIHLHFPESLKIANYFVKNFHDAKKSRYTDVNFFQKPTPIKYVYQGDQCFNMHDCGRFSLIYLLHSLDHDMAGLSCSDVYCGFKTWIEGKNGLLTYQKGRIKKEEGLKGRSNERNKLASEISEKFNQKDAVKEIDLKLKKLRETKMEKVEEMTPLIEAFKSSKSEERTIEITKSLKAIEEEINVINDQMTVLNTQRRGLSDEAFAPVRKMDIDIEKSRTLREQKAPPLKPGLWSWITKPYRLLIDLALKII